MKSQVYFIASRSGDGRPQTEAKLERLLGADRPDRASDNEDERKDPVARREREEALLGKSREVRDQTTDPDRHRRRTDLSRPPRADRNRLRLHR